MSKEPEDLDISALLKFIDDWLNRYDVCNIDYNFYKIKQALQRLKVIYNTKPSEALEELNRIDCNITYILSDCDINEEVRICLNSIREYKSCKIIKQALLKAQEEHKLLEIIKEKVMNLVSVSDGRVWDGELYQSNKLTEEESVILNRWKNE